MSLTAILLIAALIVFIIAVFNPPVPPRLNLIALGLALWLLAILLGGGTVTLR